MKQVLLLFLTYFVHSCVARTTGSSDTSVARDLQEYERCKATHRCPRAFSTYDVDNATYWFASAAYQDGELEPCAVFADFEDWKQGLRGWTRAPGSLEEDSRPSHFTSFEFELLDELEVADNHWLTFNTSSLDGTFGNETASFNFTGEIGLTAAGTEVAVFNFRYIDIGVNCSIDIIGDRAIALLSRSSINLRSQIVLPPGSVGGFPGGKDVGINNINGPGSPSARVYLKTIRTSGDDIKEVQTVTTSANKGQTLGGYFTLYFRHGTTGAIPHDASPELFKSRLERATKNVGKVDVTRGPRSPEGGYTWTIIFRTALGDLPQLQIASNSLKGIGAKVETATVTDGNLIDGTFRLTFSGLKTEPIPFHVTSERMEAMILQGLAPKVKTVVVQRSDAIMDREETRNDHFGACDHGLCADGPGPGKGLVWTLLFTTEEGNVTPFSPTSPLANTSDPADPLQITQVVVTHGVNANVEIYDGHQFLVHGRSFTGQAHVDSMFSLSFGGGGGSYANPGISSASAIRSTNYIDPSGTFTEEAAFQAEAHIKPAYGTAEMLTDLLGGSGGAIGGIALDSILRHYPPAGVGGHGGGAIEIVAVNDITFGEEGLISADGQPGQDAAWGGGGGSGGAVHIAAGGSIWMQEGAIISAKGGKGGTSFTIDPTQTSDGSGGRVAVYGKALSIDGDPRTAIEAGSIHVETDIGPEAHIDPNIGAAGTQSSLKLQVLETVASFNKDLPPIRSPFVRNGPVFDISNYYLVEDENGTISLDFTSERPGRVSLYMMIGDDSTLAGTIRDISTGYVALHDFNKSETETMIGTAVVNGRFSHGSNFVHTPRNTFFKNVQQNRWYKLDIFMDWDMKTYSIRLNDIEYVLDAPFTGDGLGSIGLYGYHQSVVWFDEVFIGSDDTMYFRCPQSSFTPDSDEAIKRDGTTKERKSVGTIEMERPYQTDWNDEWLGTTSSESAMTRHDSHLSARPIYTGTSHGITFGTGGSHQRFRSEVGDSPTNRVPRKGTVDMGILLHTPTDQDESGISQDFLQRSKSVGSGSSTGWQNSHNNQGSNTNDASTGRFFWYGEHVNPRAADEPHLYGGVMACSTSDFVTWRNEGTMYHFTNITYDGGVPRLRIDLHGGVDGIGVPTYGKRHTVEIGVEETVGTGNWTNTTLFVERPKVLFNNLTKEYVMWSEVHDETNELGVATVATSEFPGGPFEIRDTFLPDGNQTHDQTIIEKPDGTALLVRTYYTTIDYVLPEPVMQPLWESVKQEDGDIDFGLNYHRSIYKVGYDDSNDICIQRVRKEDISEEIRMLPDNETMAVSEWIRNAYSGNGTLENFVLEEQSEPWKTREVIGQGNPIVESRFKHPNWTVNNAWMPNSVPAVKAQSWMYNYMDGNIADNVVHETLPDKLIGPPQIVEQRRAKYIAVSLLSSDFLTTSGVMSIVEGYMENGESLASVINNINELGLDASADPGWYPRRFFPAVCEGGANDDEWEDCNEAELQPQESTAPGQVWGLDGPFNFKTEYDWSWRYHQYRWAFNDRKDAPINFDDQLVDWFEPGRGESSTTKGRDYIREYDYNCFRGPNEYPEDDPLHVPADPLFKHELSQHYTKTEGADIDSVSAHLLDW